MDRDKEREQAKRARYLKRNDEVSIESYRRKGRKERKQ